VGRILGKLEEVRAYGTAFEIVQRFAQRAADAGDDVAARRYTEKMRSLRVLAGSRRGGDLPRLSDPGASLGPPQPAATAAAPRAAERFDPPALDPGRLDLDAAPALGPTGAAGDLDAALQELSGAATPDRDAERVPERPSSAGDEPQAEDEPPPAASGWDRAPLSLEGGADSPERAEMHGVEPATPEIDQDRMESREQGQAQDLGEAPDLMFLSELTGEADAGSSPGGRPASPETGEEEVPEYELPDTSLEDVAALLGVEGALGAAARGPLEDDEPAPPAVAAEAGGGLELEPAGGADAPPAPPTTAPAPPPAPVRPAARPEPAVVESPAPGRRALREPVWIPDDMLDEPNPSGGRFHELEEVIDAFREQMSRALGDDAAARYDLGVAYYEMGLYNEALAEFEAAVHSVALRERGLEMMVACLAMQGRHTEIVELLSPLLRAHGTASLGPGLRYSMGVACEALGRREEARRHFEEVALVDSGFRDVQARLQRC
jgi:hypothetical protein